VADFDKGQQARGRRQVDPTGNGCASTAPRSRRPRQASKYSCVQLGCRLGDQVADQNNITKIVTWEIEMAHGTVKWFNPTKGYGFIQPQAGGKDVFVHISAVERAGRGTLNEGQHIEYEIEENRGKTSAVNLKVK
jgi:CspA family cold shock protein